MPLAIILSTNMKGIGLSIREPFPRDLGFRMPLVSEFRTGASVRQQGLQVFLLFPPISITRFGKEVGKLVAGEILIRCLQGNEYLVKVEGNGR